MKKKTNTTEHTGITKRDVVDIMSQDYVDYALSVIIDRSLPDIRDGLKPVHRRILWTIRNTNEYTKCARIVGSVIGRLSPHGDGSVYDALVRLAQPFKMLYPLVDGHGNFGSVDGDSAAAMRYTECKADSKMSELFFTYNVLGMDFKPNYDDKETEPVFLPAAFPTVLLNSTVGMAVGYACDIPSHNINEILNTYKAFVEGKLTSKNIRKYLKGPDFPTKCIIHDVGEGLDRAYSTGSGSYLCESIWEVEPGTYGRQTLVIKSVLPQKSKEDEIKKIARLYKNDKSNMRNIMTKISDESDMNDIRIVITLRKGVSAKAAIEQFKNDGIFFARYRYTSNIIVNNTPMKLSIIDIMSEFHKHHTATIGKDLGCKIEKLSKDLHLYKGLEIILRDLKRAVNIIVTAESNEELRLKMLKIFPKLDKAQLDYVLDMKMRSLMGKKTIIKGLISSTKGELAELKRIMKHKDELILQQIESQKSKFKSSKRICKIIRG